MTWGDIPSPLESSGAGTGVLDHPKPAAGLRSGIHVTGWVVLAAAEPVARVQVRVVDAEGRVVARALMRTHVPRPDVAEGLGTAAAFCGFAGWVPLQGDIATAAAPARLTVEVEVVGLAGGTWSPHPRTVVVTKPRATSSATRHLNDGLGPVAAAERRDVDHVGVVTHQLGLGGGQLYLHELLRQLVHVHGLRASVLSAAGGLLSDELEAWGVDVVIDPKLGVQSPEQFAESVRSVASFLRSHRVGSVLVNTLGSVFAVEAAGRCGLPAVWSIHESFDLGHFRGIVTPPDGGPPELVDHWYSTLRSAWALVFEAEATRRMFLPFTGPGAALTVPYGIDLTTIDAVTDERRTVARHRAGLSPTARVLVCIGTFEVRKGQAFLVDAFEAAARGRRDCHLVLVGAADDAYTRALRERVTGSAVADKVSLVPVTPDLDPWYAAADVIVSVSDVESMPRSMIEAMARGLPVLSSGVFGIPELVPDGECGWLFEPNDLGAAAARLADVLDLEASAVRAAGEVARGRVLAGYSSAGYGAAYAALLRGLARDPSAPPGPLVAGSMLPAEADA